MTFDEAALILNVKKADLLEVETELQKMLKVCPLLPPLPSLIPSHHVASYSPRSTEY